MKYLFDILFIISNSLIFVFAYTAGAILSSNKEITIDELSHIDRPLNVSNYKLFKRFYALTFVSLFFSLALYMIGR